MWKTIFWGLDPHVLGHGSVVARDVPFQATRSMGRWRECVLGWQSVHINGSGQSAGWWSGQVEFRGCFVLLLSHWADGVYTILSPVGSCVGLVLCPTSPVSSLRGIWAFCRGSKRRWFLTKAVVERGFNQRALFGFLHFADYVAENTFLLCPHWGVSHTDVTEGGLGKGLDRCDCT